MNKNCTAKTNEECASDSDTNSLDNPSTEYPAYVFIRKGPGFKRVTVREIAYLEAQRNYCNIYLDNGTYLNVTIPMNEVYEYLNPANFKRIHRSFVVNLEYVDTYMGNLLVLNNGKEIVIGREYRDALKKEFICIGSRKRIREKENE